MLCNVFFFVFFPLSKSPWAIQDLHLKRLYNVNRLEPTNYHWKILLDKENSSFLFPWAILKPPRSLILLDVGTLRGKNAMGYRWKCKTQIQWNHFQIMRTGGPLQSNVYCLCARIALLLLFYTSCCMSGIKTCQFRLQVFMLDVLWCNFKSTTRGSKTHAEKIVRTSAIGTRCTTHEWAEKDLNVFWVHSGCTKRIAWAGSDLRKNLNDLLACWWVMQWQQL